MSTPRLDPPRSRAREGNLEIRRSILLGIEAAAIHVPRAPEQQIVIDVDEIVLLEAPTLREPEGSERLSKMLCRLVGVPPERWRREQ